MTLCACLDALMARAVPIEIIDTSKRNNIISMAVPHAPVRASCMYINTKVIACLDV